VWPILKRLLCAAALAVAASSPVAAQSFPSKSIRIIVPFPPGGFNDTLARTLGQKLNERWGQPVVVDNRPGAGSTIGTELVARAPADGYTLLVVSFAFAVNPSLFPRLPYDTGKDFAPVILAAGTPNFLVAHPTVPATTARDLLTLARARPGALTYATAGNGTSNHLCMKLLESLAGVQLTHIPYKGSAPAVLDLVGGRISVMFDNAPNVLSQVRAGKLRALAVTTAKRSALTPEVPTLAEAGVPGYDVEVWFGLVAPAATPREIVAKLNAEMDRILALPEVKSRFADQGVRTIGGPPEQFAAHLREQMAKWAKVVKDAAVRLD
jgi:tripartite-type tricarboxylate transporter receptor subunit TctC